MGPWPYVSGRDSSAAILPAKWTGLRLHAAGRAGLLFA